MEDTGRLPVTGQKLGARATSDALHRNARSISNTPLIVDDDSRIRDRKTDDVVLDRLPAEIVITQRRLSVQPCWLR